MERNSSQALPTIDTSSRNVSSLFPEFRYGRSHQSDMLIKPAGTPTFALEAPNMRRDREDDERKQRLVEAVKRQRAISEGKKREADFIHKFLQKKNTMTKNINIALHQIKSHQGEDEARKQVTDIKADIEEGTRLAMQNRVKTVSKDAHRHDVIKTDMKTIMEKAPLIVRNQWKLPVYPKLNYNST